MLKLSNVINYPLRLLGLKLVKLSSLKKLQEPGISYDIERDKEFLKIYEKIKGDTLVEIERCYALYMAVEYILKNKIEGDFVECGVWRGGSCMLIAYLLMKAGISDRKIWLYDTFTGMTKPGINDGKEEMKEWEERKMSDEKNGWCLATIDDVENNMKSTKYPFENIRLVKGRVEDTIPATQTDSIALLRLDTDWYKSTKHELLHLYPLLEKGGILIIDDYGAWQGAKKAVDEYFAANGQVYLNRVDYTGRLVIK